MTAQFGEKLRCEGRVVSMFSQPLGDYFSLGGARPEFDCSCTALWRGYVGTWDITEGRLYLVALSGDLKDGRKASLATVFPGFPDRVFAHWYSGTLRIPDGKMVEYVHMAFASTYERDLIVRIDKGVVIGTDVRHNGTSEDSCAPEGYGVGAMTVFPRARPGTDDDK